MPGRRAFIRQVGAAGTIALTAGCIGQLGSQPYSDGTVNFLMSPSEPQSQMMKQYRPYANYLDKQIDNADVSLKYARNYSGVLQALDSATGDVAETGPFAAALGVKADKVDIALQRHAFGSWTYSSVIVTTEDTDIQQLTDLKGKTIAFADMLSASGSLYPLFMLKQAGLSIGQAPKSAEGADFQATWSGHAQAFKALTQGQADAAGVGRFITVTDTDANNDGERDYKKGIVEVAREKGIPRAPIIVSPQLSSDEKNSIVNALKDAPKSAYQGADGKADTDDDLWFDDVRPASVETYQPVINVAETLGIKVDLLNQATGG